MCQDVESSFAISDISMSATDDDCLGDYVLIEGRAALSRRYKKNYLLSSLQRLPTSVAPQQLL